MIRSLHFFTLCFCIAPENNSIHRKDLASTNSGTVENKLKSQIEIEFGSNVSGTVEHFILRILNMFIYTYTTNR